MQLLLRSTLKLQQLETLPLVVFIALISQVATAGVNHEHADQNQQQQQQQHYHRSTHEKDAEARQFGGGIGGFNANAAFNSNFGSSSFGLNLVGPNNGNQFSSSTSSTSTSSSINYNPTTSRPQTFTTYNNPSNFNSINSIPSQSGHKQQPNKNTYNDYNQKYPGTHVIDRFDHHYPDGSYEYRYELADGTARYERGYFLIYDKTKTLVVVGYYSYRMPDGRYITVFYNADQNGYRQNQSITPQNYPNLPRSIDVPQFKSAGGEVYAEETTTRKPTPTTTTATHRSGRF